MEHNEIIKNVHKFKDNNNNNNTNSHMLFYIYNNIFTICLCFLT